MSLPDARFDHVSGVIEIRLALLADRVAGHIVSFAVGRLAGVEADELFDLPPEAIVLKLGERFTAGGLLLEHGASRIEPGATDHRIADGSGGRIDRKPFGLVGPAEVNVQRLGARYQAKDAAGAEVQEQALRRCQNNFSADDGDHIGDHRWLVMHTGRTERGVRQLS